MKPAFFHLLLIGISLISISLIKAQVVVAPGVFPTMCPGGPAVTQTKDIVIKETQVDDFSGTGGDVHYYEIPLNLNFEGLEGVGTATFYPIGKWISFFNYVLWC